MTEKPLKRRALLMLGAAGCAFGTGAFAQSSQKEVEGGIGGTGIVGILSEFGSIRINGMRVLTGADTEFTDGFGKIRERDLGVGDSLTVEASPSGNDMIARRVHVTYPLVGVISDVAADKTSITVNGVTVALPGGLGRFSTGDRVAISGLWREQQVVASRIVGAQSNNDLVSGDVIRRKGARGIGGVTVKGAGIARTKLASFATAIGRFDDDKGIFRAETVTEGRFTGAAGPLQQLSIEGYLEPINAAPGYKISGLGHSFDRKLSLGAFADTRVLFAGPYTGLFKAEAATVLPEDATARKRILQQIEKRR